MSQNVRNSYFLCDQGFDSKAFCPKFFILIWNTSIHALVFFTYGQIDRNPFNNNYRFFDTLECRFKAVANEPKKYNDTEVGIIRACAAATYFSEELCGCPSDGVLQSDRKFYHVYVSIQAFTVMFRVNQQSAVFSSTGQRPDELLGRAVVFRPSVVRPLAILLFTLQQP